MNETKIEKIRIYSAKGEAGKELSEARLIENLGLEGDFHATGGERQLSLLFAETREELMAHKERGLCFSRFRENLTVSGHGSNTFRPGARFAIGETRSPAGEAVLEITAENKRCHQECPLYEVGRQCPLAGRSLFAKVLKSGAIHAGDVVKEK